MIDIKQNIEPSPIKAEMEKISKEVAERKKSPEAEGVSEKELIKEALRPIIEEQPSSSSAPAPAVAPPPSSGSVLPQYLQNSSAEIKSQVEKMVNAVFQQGLEKTVKEVKKQSAFFIDAFHDSLADKLYEELKRRKMI